MPYFLQHFSKNWVKTLVHGTLQKKLLISRRSTSFGGFSPNALLFATFFQKLGQNPSARYFAEKVAYFEEIDKFLVVFHQMPYFCNIFPKIGSKTLVHGTLQKSCLFRGDRQVLVVFHQMPYFLQTFFQKLGQNPSARYFAEKVAYFEEIDKFWWFFTKCPTFCNIFPKIGSKP